MVPFGGQGFKISDEIYRTDPPLYSRDKALVLMSLDLSDPATKGAKGVREGDEDTGISWIKTWGPGTHVLLLARAQPRHHLDASDPGALPARYSVRAGRPQVDTTPKPAAAQVLRWINYLRRSRRTTSGTAGRL